MKKQLIALCAAVMTISAFAEVFPVTDAADIKVSTFAGLTANVEKAALPDGKACVKITCALPELEKKQRFDIRFTKLDSIKWKSIKSIKITCAGGYGRTTCSYVDSGKEFFTPKPKSLWGGKTLKTMTYVFDNTVGIWAPHNGVKNKTPDAPLTINSWSITLEKDWAKGLVANPFLITGIEVDGERMDAPASAK